MPFLLPNVPVHLAVPKPELAADQGDDLASCLRRRRRQLGLSQPDAARAIGVCKASVWQWENGRATPEDSLYPNVIAFLGREPWPEPVTLGERLRVQRRRRGLTVKAAARVMGVAHGSVSNWENGATFPNQESRNRSPIFLPANAKLYCREIQLPSSGNSSFLKLPFLSSCSHWS